MGPKKQKLREAEESLEDANSKLREKQRMLKAVEDRVEGLKRQLTDAQREQRELSDQADLTKKRLERAVRACVYLCLGEGTGASPVAAVLAMR